MGGVGLLALVGMGVGLGYLARSNARLEEANAKLRAVNADLEQTDAELAAARGSTGASRPPEPKPPVRTDPGRDPKPPVKGDPGRDPIGPKPSPPPAKDLTALENDLAKLRQSAGPDDPRTLRAKAEWGQAMIEAGRVAGGVKILEEASRRAAEPRLGGGPGPDPYPGPRPVGDRAGPPGGRGVRGLRDDLPDRDPLEPEVKLQLARAYRANGQWDKAKPLFLSHLVAAQKKARDSREAAQALGWVAECLLRLGDPAGAEPLARESLDLWARKRRTSGRCSPPGAWWARPSWPARRTARPSGS